MIHSQQDEKCIDFDDGKTPEDRIADQVTPLWRLSYEEQLERKEKAIKSLLQNFKNELRKFLPKQNFSDVPETDMSLSPLKRIKGMTSEQRALVQLAWLREAVKENKGIPCPLDPILPSPMIEGYRSKYEFTFGKDLNGEKTCGFLLGLFKKGFHAVLNPRQCLHVSNSAKCIANILEEYVSKSNYDVYDRINKVGVYRGVLVRTMSSGQCMLIFQINPSSLSEAQIEDEKIVLKTFLLEQASHVDDLTINALYLQLSSDVFNGFKDETPSELIHGVSFVTETLLDNTFQISPSSFFQVNHSATEILYSKIREISIEVSRPPADSNSHTEIKDVVVDNSEDAHGVVLLDLCCGTGTIGISIARHVKKVIGVELTAEAIEDAKRNAAANGLNFF